MRNMNYWILQSNPAKFRILNWLIDFDWIRDPILIDCWHINFFCKNVHNDDVVFIWKSKGKDKIRGIYAKGTIVATPVKFPVEDKEIMYFVDKKEMHRLTGLDQIAVRYSKIYIDNPLLEDTLRKVPSLASLRILGNSRHGIQQLTYEEGEIIERMLP